MKTLNLIKYSQGKSEGHDDYEQWSGIDQRRDLSRARHNNDNSDLINKVNIHYNNQKRKQGRKISRLFSRS